MKESPASCGIPALGGEDRHKAWKKADSFQEQKELFRVSSCFPTLPLHTALVLPQPALLSFPSPKIAGTMESPRLGTAAQAEGGGGKGWPCRHPCGTPADGRCTQLCPSVPPTGWAGAQRRAAAAQRDMWPCPQDSAVTKNKRQPVVHQE